MVQLIISIQTTLIVFPPSMFIVTVFRKARPKRNKVQQNNQQVNSSPGSARAFQTQEMSQKRTHHRLAGFGLYHWSVDTSTCPVGQGPGRFQQVNGNGR